MKKLLSLPPNLTGCFHDLTGHDVSEWFCTSDPVGARLGSGGGTAWLLESCRIHEDKIGETQGKPGVGHVGTDRQNTGCHGWTPDTAAWLGKEKRILLHAGGQGRRVPAYAPSGKILTPVPVFRWERGQKLSQDLLSLQLPLYEKIMARAPESLHTLIASGDVYIRSNEPLQEIPEADVVCYGLWADPSLASRHGVFVTDRKSPDTLAFMLQKPSLEELSALSSSHFFMMDIGIWLLSDKAVRILWEHSMAGQEAASAERNTNQATGDKDRSGGHGHMTEGFREYDLYSEFGPALGDRPQIKDKDINALTVAILPLPGGEFYHYGTSREIITSSLAVQNLVNDQRHIMQHTIKPHPAMFIQNAMVRTRLSPDNAMLWIENSFIGPRWNLSQRHLITGVPENDWCITLPEGVCIDVVPYGKNTDYGPCGEKYLAARPYGFDDPFKGASDDPGTIFMGRPFKEWTDERGISLPEFKDLQNARIFPLCTDADQLGKVLRWMISDPSLDEGRKIWENAEKVSANMISDNADLRRLFAQRKKFRAQDWPMLASNWSKSIFYQLDLEDTAEEYASENLPLPEILPDSAPLMMKIQDSMFRSRVLSLKAKGQDGYDAESMKMQKRAFSLLREGLTGTIAACRQSPHLNVYPDQIVWGRSPVRIDLAGGWTDTPPYCIYAGGNVVNIAIELNGQPPLQVYVKPADCSHIILRSIDLGAMEVVSDWESLRDFNKVGSPFSIPKAALALAGFLPEFSAGHFSSLEEQLKDFGCGIEVTLLAAIPAGSGLGTSSILAATVLGALSDFCALAWDKSEIGYRTLILEQLLTTGGGWQDQYGGILHGAKLLQTSSSMSQIPSVRWLPEYIFTQPEYKACHLLYYTGITRTAKGILAEIVRRMFLNSGPHLNMLSEMKAHAMNMFDVIQKGDFSQYGSLVKESWEENKALDSGTNPPAVEKLISMIDDLASGYKLPGAGGGGYLYMVAKDPEAAGRIRRILTDNPLNAKARFVEMSLSDKGLQISRS